MTSEEFTRLMIQFQDSGYVEAVAQTDDHTFVLVMCVADGRTQNVSVTVAPLNAFEMVTAYAPIGLCPDDPGLYKLLLTEDMDCHYTRLGVIGDKLVQMYRYRLDELTQSEFLKALLELSAQAHACRQHFADAADDN